MTEWITCEVCDTQAERDKSLRLTPWDEPVTDATEWCCVRCASRAFKEG
jgi:hypothetical protein